MEETRKKIQILGKQGFFDNWLKKETGLITFLVHKDTKLDKDWFEKRMAIYKMNAQKLKITPPKVMFYVYPSLEFGKERGITPATSFVKSKEIHSHPHQSPGHELTHILLGEINDTDNLPANGIWSEGVCVYLDGTNTDRRKHALSLNYTEDIINTSWGKWRYNLSGKLYPLAGSIIQYLNNSLGWGKILTFLKESRNSSNNDAELSEAIFKKRYSKLQENWRKWLKLKGG